MTEKPTPSVFLQRAGYRQRRLRDAARLMPFLGLVLLAIPLVWGEAPAGENVSSTRLLYVFGVWVVLIVLTAVLSRAIGADVEKTDRDQVEE